MSNENISEDSSLCDRQPFDYVSCEGLRETRSCYQRHAGRPDLDVHLVHVRGRERLGMGKMAFPGVASPADAKPALVKNLHIEFSSRAKRSILGIEIMALIGEGMCG